MTLTREAKEGGREWVRDYFASPEDVAEDDRLQAVLAAVDAIEAARPAEARCPWREDEWGTWITGCGRMWQYEVGGPADNDARYCYGCGGVIEAAPYGEPTERSPDA